MMNLVRNFIREENGEDLIEYGLLAAFVASVALVTIILDPLGIKGALTGVVEPNRLAQLHRGPASGPRGGSSPHG